MHVRTFKRDGYVVLRKQLGGEVLAGLSAACDHVLTQVRAGSSSTGHSSTHITGLLAPEHYTDRPELLEQLACFVSSPMMVALVADLGRAREGEPNVRSLEYFHEPSSRDYDGAWHRDGDDVVLAEPQTRSTLLRVRIAFAPDDHLEYVPGSHVRDDTAAELRMRRGPIRNAALSSDAVRIALEPGDVCVFDTWGIHRGRYRTGAQRRTLDVLFGYGPRRVARFASMAEYRKRLRRA